MLSHLLRRYLNPSIISIRSEFSYLNLIRFPFLNHLKIKFNLMPRQYHLFVRLPLLISIALLVLMGTFSKRGLLDWKRMVHQNQKLEQKMLSVQEQKWLLEKQIEQFQKSSEEQERVVRQVLGYIKPNEKVIEFP